MRPRRLVVPATAFVAALAVHFVWRGTHPECAPGAEECFDEACAPDSPWLASYLDAGDWWLGLSYAASAAYVVATVRRAVERSSVATALGAAPGMAYSALLPFVGCWLAGCCGSPLLPVYLGLLGGAFLPFAKPLVATLTVSMLAVSWLWMRRREKKAQCGSVVCSPTPGCDCS